MLLINSVSALINKFILRDLIQDSEFLKFIIIDDKSTFVSNRATLEIFIYGALRFMVHVIGKQDRCNGISRTGPNIQIQVWANLSLLLDRSMDKNASCVFSFLLKIHEVLDS